MTTHDNEGLQSEFIVPSGEQEVMRLYDGSLIEAERLLYPESLEDALRKQAQLLDNLARIKLEGRHVALMTGVYDVPHDNHTWFAREARLRAARSHFGDRFDQGTQKEKQAMVASDDIALILTLNADAKVAARKSFQSNKGNIARPVYTWNARANRMGGLTIPDGRGTYRPVVDLIVVDGEPSHYGSMFESHFEFGRQLASYDLLDTWIIFGEHEAAVIDTVRDYVQGRESIISVIPENEARFAIDPRTGTYWNSSSIIHRVQGRDPNPQEG